MPTACFTPRLRVANGFAVVFRNLSRRSGHYPCPALASVDDCGSLMPSALCPLGTRFPPVPSEEESLLGALTDRGLLPRLGYRSSAPAAANCTRLPLQRELSRPSPKAPSSEGAVGEAD